MEPMLESQTALMTTNIPAKKIKTPQFMPVRRCNLLGPITINDYTESQGKISERESDVLKEWEYFNNDEGSDQQH